MTWVELIRDLKAAGLTQEAIASDVGISQPSVSALARGTVTRPSFEVGDKLMRLHARTKRRAGVRAEAKAA